MTSSASYDYSIDRDGLINLAHQHIGAIGEGETCSTAQITEASKLLNMLCKLRASDGMPLWALKRGIILPFTDASSILTNSHVVTSYNHTTTSAAAVLGASTIVITATTGFANGYTIGVELSDGTMQWTTINGALSGSTVTLTATLTAAVSSGADVYVYQTTNRIQRPLRLLEANILRSDASNSYSIEQIARGTYYTLGNRTVEGMPNQFYYDPAMDNGEIFVYPRFSNGDAVIEFTYHRPFQDFDTSTDTPDFPQEFYLCLMVGLAALLGPKFGVSIEERAALMKEAEYYLTEALETVVPEGSMLIQAEKR